MWTIAWQTSWTTALSLMKNIVQTLANSVFIPLGLTAVALAADARIHKKILELGNNNIEW